MTVVSLHGKSIVNIETTLADAEAEEKRKNVMRDWEEVKGFLEGGASGFMCIVIDPSEDSEAIMVASGPGPFDSLSKSIGLIEMLKMHMTEINAEVSAIE